VLHKGGTTEEEPAAEIDAKAIKMSVGCIRQNLHSFLNRISESICKVVRAYGQSIQVTSCTRATPKSIEKLQYLCQLYTVFRKVFLPSSTRGLSQIWLQIREESRKVYGIVLYFGEMLIHVRMDHGSRCWKLKHSLLTRSSNCRVVMTLEDLIWIPVPRELLVVSKNVLSGHIGF
jgi:hypothetical protein